MSNGPKKWSCVNFVTIFGDLYKIKLWGICNNFNQFAHLSLASGPSNDVIKMVAIAQLHGWLCRKGQLNGYANEIFTTSSGHELQEQ